MSNCRDSKGRLTTVGVQYRKDGGNTITAQFGWQFSNADGTSVLNGDTGASFTQEPHHDKHQIFYYTGLVFPKGYPCVRGVLYSGGNTYVTKTEC